MKVLAKIGLIVAAAATVFLVFIFEVYKPKVSNKTMSSAPEQQVGNTPQNLLETPEQITESTSNIEEPLSPELTEELTPGEAVETANESIIIEEPLVTPAEVQTREVQTRNIYGKITLANTGENLAGVNIMIPGSNVAKISNNIGGYTIEVPVGTRELVFIYRGKKLVQRIGSNNNLVNVRLNLDAMEYD